jgi:hypothetical protein
MKRILLVILLLATLTAPDTLVASLTFGAATSDRVNHGSAASLDNLDPFSYALWVYPTTVTGNRIIIAKSSAAGSPNGKFLGFEGASTRIQFIVDRVTTDTNYVTNLTALTTNKWWFVAVTFNSAGAVGEIANIYQGDLTATLAEGTYSTATDGSGANRDEAAISLSVANSTPATPASAFQGRIAWVGVWNRELSLAELRAQQFHPAKTSGNVLFAAYGFNGTGSQIDWSGNANAGTVTGASLTPDHVALGPLFGFDDDLPYNVSTAATPCLRSLMGVGC